jgi:riboflavin kinase/FMN adenylyltransferase
MQIFRSLEAIAAQSQPSTATVGSFDGIHRAHAALLRRVQECARQQSAVSVAVTFDPHPVAVLAPQRAPRVLTPLPIKLELLARSGIERLLILPFTDELSRWSPEMFVGEVLVKALRVRSVIVGENFRFGHKQAGTPSVLGQLGQRFHFHTEVIPSMRYRGRMVSSSQIRALLEQGQVRVANRLLGYPFTVRGGIERGRGIGSRQTVPTLNLGADGGLLPRDGVYVTAARIGSEVGTGPSSVAEGAQWAPPVLSRPLRSVTNVGYSPTFGERERRVETHLIEPWEGFEEPGQAAKLLDVKFLYRLRDERRFESPEALKAQILRDVQRAGTYFRRLDGKCALPSR